MELIFSCTSTFYKLVFPLKHLFILYLLEHCQQEIDEVLKGKDKACFDDRNNMPYVQVNLPIIITTVMKFYTVLCFILYAVTMQIILILN